MKHWYHFFLAWLGSVLYQHPSRDFFVIGVTGTKGKSTTAELLAALLETAGKKVALLSSVRTKIGPASEPNTTGNTMPGRFFIQRFLRRAVRAGATHAILEVTSQGILQSRHRFIDFDAAVFTNLHPEHIESHGSLESYREAKVSFFRDVARAPFKTKKFFIINQQDASGRYFFEAVHGFGEVYYFDRAEFCGRFPRGGLSSWLRVDFNVENAAAAAKMAEILGVQREQVRRALAEFSGVAGRMEVIQEKPFRVVVDYAHTPDSLEQVYTFLGREARKGMPKKKTATLICILGSAGGGRDRWKRPVFGRIAAEHCRHIILTNEDPYNESPEAIAIHIAEGFVTSEERRRKPISHETILDRGEAIRRGIALARGGDTVVITGKGSESVIHVENGRTIPWSDRETAKEALRLHIASPKRHKA